jgi:hypothetical protein
MRDGRKAAAPSPAGGAPAPRRRRTLASAVDEGRHDLWRAPRNKEGERGRQPPAGADAPRVRCPGSLPSGAGASLRGSRACRGSAAPRFLAPSCPSLHFRLNPEYLNKPKPQHPRPPPRLDRRRRVVPAPAEDLAETASPDALPEVQRAQRGGVGRAARRGGGGAEQRQAALHQRDHVLRFGTRGGRGVQGAGGVAGGRMVGVGPFGAARAGRDAARGHWQGPCRGASGRPGRAGAAAGALAARAGCKAPPRPRSAAHHRPHLAVEGGRVEALGAAAAAERGRVGAAGAARRAARRRRGGGSGDRVHGGGVAGARRRGSRAGRRTATSGRRRHLRAQEGCVPRGSARRARGAARVRPGAAARHGAARARGACGLARRGRRAWSGGRGIRRGSSAARPTRRGSTASATAAARPCVGAARVWEPAGALSGRGGESGGAWPKTSGPRPRARVQSNERLGRAGGRAAQTCIAARGACSQAPG